METSFTPNRPYTKFPTEDKIIFSIVLLCLAWLGLCLVSALWLKYSVPLTSEDLAHASWLASYTSATHFTGVLSAGLIIVSIIMASGIAVAKNSAMLFIPGLVVAGTIWMAGSEDTMVRVGINAGSIKIGCYAYESRECHEMLGVPVGGAPSRYASEAEQAEGKLDADWYTQAKGEQPTSPWDAMPGGYLIRTPFLLGKEAELNHKIAAQRAEVEKFQKEAHKP